MGVVLHCPFCQSDEVTSWEEDFNHETGFWGQLLLNMGIFTGWFTSHKQTKCKCNKCGGEFSFYDE